MSILQKLFGWALPQQRGWGNDTEFLHDLGSGGGQSEAGEIVNHRTALTYSPVWQCVSMLSGDVAKLPLVQYRRRSEWGDNGRERLTNSLTQLLTRRPNDEVSAFTMWRRFIAHYCLWGEAYLYLDREQGGQVQAIANLLPDRTRPHRDRATGQLVYHTEVDGTLVTLMPEDVFRIEWLNFNNTDAVDLVASARDSWGLALAAESFASRFFSSGTQAGGVLELPPTMTPKAMDNVEQGWRKKYTSKDNWFRTVILRDGAKFHQVTIDPERTQQQQLREDQVREVARRYNLPPSRLGLSDSVSYNSRTEDNQSYLESTLAPILESIAAEANIKLVADSMATSVFFEHNTNSLLKMDLKSRYEAYEIGIRSGWFSPDDVRAKENEAPRPDGFGDVYLSPVNLAPTEQLVEDDTDLTQDSQQDQGQEMEEEEDQDQAQELEALSLDVRRWVYSITVDGRHQVRRSHRFVTWVDGGLSKHRVMLKRLGGPEVILDDFCRSLNKLLDRCPEEELPGQAEELFRDFEATEATILERIKCEL